MFLVKDIPVTTAKELETQLNKVRDEVYGWGRYEPHTIHIKLVKIILVKRFLRKSRIIAILECDGVERTSDY